MRTDLRVDTRGGQHINASILHTILDRYWRLLQPLAPVCPSVHKPGNFRYETAPHNGHAMREPSPSLVRSRRRATGFEMPMGKPLQQRALSEIAFCPS